MARAKKTARVENQGLHEKKVSLGTDINGKRIRKSIYGKSKTEAKLNADAYKDAHRRQELLSEDMIFSELSAKWLLVYKKGSVRSSTYYTMYEPLVRNHLDPYFGKASVQSIKPIDIMTFFKEKANYSDSTKDKLRITLSAIFEAAIDNDMIQKNPCRSLEQFNHGGHSKNSKIRRSYTKEQADKVLAFAKTHAKGDSITFLLKTGVRRGELLGVTWDDIDFAINVLKLRRSVSKTKKDGKWIIEIDTSAANKNHYRDIPFDKDLKAILEDMHEKYIERTEKKFNPEGYIFANANGELCNPERYDKNYYNKFMRDFKNHCQSQCEKDLSEATSKEQKKMILENYAIPLLTAHELRHTCGTLLYRRGVDMRTIQKVLGHADIKITSGTYIEDNVEHMISALGYK